MESNKLESFYSDVLNKAKELSAVFEEYIEEIKKTDLNKIQNDFHEFIADKFELKRFNETESGFEERLQIPGPLLIRVQISTLILNVLSLGGIYSQKLYDNTKEFCLKLKDDQLLTNSVC